MGLLDTLFHRIPFVGVSVSLLWRLLPPSSAGSSSFILVGLYQLRACRGRHVCPGAPAILELRMSFGWEMDAAFFALVFGPFGARARATPATKRCYLRCFVAFAFPGWLAGYSFWAAVSAASGARARDPM